MSKNNRIYNILITGFYFILVLSIHAKNPTVHAVNESLSLKDGMKQVQKEAKKEKNGYWIGYMIPKQMKSNSFVGSFSSKNRKKKSLLELVYHVKPATDLYSNFHFDGSIHGNFDLKDKDGTIIQKDVAILLFYPENTKNGFSFSDIKMSNMELHVDLDGKPLYWFGKKTNQESFKFLQELFHNLDKAPSMQEELLPVMAIHESDDVLPFLKNLVFNNKNNELRKNAVFWIGQQDDADVLSILKKVAYEDESTKVRKQAVFAVQCVDTDDAISLLIHLAKKGEPYKIQKEAIFWLGQKASDRCTESLKEIVYSKEKTEVQKQAVFALSEQHNITALIEIANTHPNPKVRKQAIFWLGDSGDERALDALIEMVEKTI